MQAVAQARSHPLMQGRAFHLAPIVDCYQTEIPGLFWLVSSLLRYARNACRKGLPLTFSLPNPMGLVGHLEMGKGLDKCVPPSAIGYIVLLPTAAVALPHVLLFRVDDLSAWLGQSHVPR